MPTLTLLRYRLAPRFLRKFLRFFSRLMERDILLPRCSFLFLSIFFLFLSFSYGAYLRTNSFSFVHFILLKAGFGLYQVHVVGNHKISEEEIIRNLNLESYSSLLDLSVAQIQKNLSSLAWVESVSVQKNYPDTLMIHLKEREPFAVWQCKGSFYLVDQKGEVITSLQGDTDRNFPFIVGVGATKDFQNMFSLMKKFPDIALRVKAYIRIADRRWDIKLDNNVFVKLPEFFVEKALFSLDSLHHQYALLDRDILSVDMRLPDNVVVRLSESGFAQHRLAMKKVGVKFFDLVESKT